MRAIPRVPPSGDKDRRGFDEATKEVLEVITGRRVAKIKPVNTASMTGNDLVLAQKLNEIIERLQS